MIEAMYSVRSGWTGQTFAFAARHDSDAKKIRIRRSKEERKTMVETFIKRYQSQNEGNFPSINLTHKEVGGSFYTVREIIREIIQENRVLGPSRYSSEQKMDLDLLDLPLAAISSDPQSSLAHDLVETLVNISSSGSDDLPLDGDMQLSIGLRLENGAFVSGSHCEELGKMASKEELRNSAVDHHGTVSTVSPNELVHLVNEVVAVSSPPRNCFSGPPINGDTQSSIGLVLENEQPVNGNQNGEMYESVSVVSSESGSSETNKESKLCWESAAEFANPTAELDVETFPVRPVSSNGPLHHTKDLSGTYDGFGTEQAVSSHEPTMVKSLESVNSSSNLVNQRTGDDTEVLFLDRSPRAMDGQSKTDLVSHLLKVLNQATIKEDEPVTQDCTEPIISLPQMELPMETIKQTQDPPMKESEGSRGNGVKNINTATSNTSIMESTPKKVVLNGSRVDSRDDVDEKAPKGNSPSLDRINLESWEGASKKPEPNPLLALFKALVTAFVNFWSE